MSVYEEIKADYLIRTKDLNLLCESHTSGTTFINCLFDTDTIHNYESHSRRALSQAAYRSCSECSDSEDVAASLEATTIFSLYSSWLNFS
jgi:hypothetical protein